MAERGFVKVAEVGELSPGDMKAVEIGQDQILLANVDGAIYACDDTCTHSFASLAEGDLDGDTVECPLHGATFNVTSGKATKPPAFDNIRVFEVRIQGQDILVGPPKT